MGIAFPALTDQEQASSILARWLQICNCAAVWSGGQLKFIPYGDAAIAAGTQVTVRRSDRAPDAGSTTALRRRRDHRLRARPVRRPTAASSMPSPARADLYRRARRRRRREPTASRRTELTSSLPRRRPASRSPSLISVHVSYVPNLTPVYDLDRPRLRRREGQQGPGAGLARRPVLAADDPAHRMPVARQPIRLTPVEARDQIADRALRAARRLDDPGA